MSLKGKVVIVTGADRGIVRCIAQTYGLHGALVLVAGTDKETGSESEKLIVAQGGSAAFIETDVSRPEDIKELSRRTMEISGIIDGGMTRKIIYEP